MKRKVIILVIPLFLVAVGFMTYYVYSNYTSTIKPIVGLENEAYIILHKEEGSAKKFTTIKSFNFIANNKKTVLPIKFSTYLRGSNPVYDKEKNEYIFSDASSCDAYFVKKAGDYRKIDLCNVEGAPQVQARLLKSVELTDKYYYVEFQSDAYEFTTRIFDKDMEFIKDINGSFNSIIQGDTLYYATDETGNSNKIIKHDIKTGDEKTIADGELANNIYFTDRIYNKVLVEDRRIKNNSKYFISSNLEMDINNIDSIQKNEPSQFENEYDVHVAISSEDMFISSSNDNLESYKVNGTSFSKQAEAKMCTDGSDIGYSQTNMICIYDNKLFMYDFNGNEILKSNVEKNGLDYYEVLMFK